MTNIVMLCRDRLRLTEQALATLTANTERDVYNLTLVDDSSSDFRVRRLLEAHASRPNVSLLRIEKSAHVLARAKNIGVEWSRQQFGAGDWLYLSDSDVAFLLGWLGTLTHAAYITEPDGFNLWGGQVHPFHQPIRLGVNEMVAPADQKDPWQVNEHAMLDGPSWLMRWGTWDSLGGLRGSTPGTCQSEDSDFCHRLAQNGGRIGVVHPHVVAHTGLTGTDGKDAIGRAERESQRISGIIYE